MQGRGQIGCQATGNSPDGQSAPGGKLGVFDFVSDF